MTTIEFKNKAIKELNELPFESWVDLDHIVVDGETILIYRTTVEVLGKLHRQEMDVSDFIIDGSKYVGLWVMNDDEDGVKVCHLYEYKKPNNGHINVTLNVPNPYSFNGPANFPFKY